MDLDTAFVYLILLVKSDFLKWPNFSKHGRCCFTTPYPDSTKNSFINSIDALHVLKWMFIRSTFPWIVEYTIYWWHLQLGNVDSSILFSWVMEKGGRDHTTPLWGNITCIFGILYLVYPCYIPDIVGYIITCYQKQKNPHWIRAWDCEVNFSSFLIQKYHQQAVEKGRLCPPGAA